LQVAAIFETGLWDITQVGLRQHRFGPAFCFLPPGRVCSPVQTEDLDNAKRLRTPSCQAIGLNHHNLMNQQALFSL
jgi:hypothetical protein